MTLKYRIATFLISLACLAHAQVKRALVIGLGQYADTNWSTIHGDKDIPIIKEMLKEYGYNEIHTLMNAQATKNGMVESFKQLTRKCQEGDIVYIHFSGHGQRVTDLDGDEEDGWDESWIPYDACLQYGAKDKGEKHLIDDEIGLMLVEIRGRIGTTGHILVVVDACHSGDSSRDLNNVCVRGVEKKFIIPVSTTSIPKKQQLPEYWLLLSACKSYQSNSELPNGYGKLSYGLYENRKLLHRLTNEQLVQRIKKIMDNNRTGLPQTPVLTGHEGGLVRCIFGGDK